MITVHRPEFTLPSSRTDRSLIRAGAEKINGQMYVRYERWNRRRRAFVLEALVLFRSRTRRKLDIAL
jgi:hypothetical protein